MPIVDKYRDMGTMIMGKSEQGLVQIGDVLQVRWRANRHSCHTRPWGRGTGVGGGRLGPHLDRGWCRSGTCCR
jgi:hypothetical protein